MLPLPTLAAVVAAIEAVTKLATVMIESQTPEQRKAGLGDRHLLLTQPLFDLLAHLTKKHLAEPALGIGDYKMQSFVTPQVLVNPCNVETPQPPTTP